MTDITQMQQAVALTQLARGKLARGAVYVLTATVLVEGYDAMVLVSYTRRKDLSA